MRKILLANIGNRNILFKGVVYDRLPPEQKLAPSFREFTRKLLDTYHSHKADIALNILDKLIGKHAEELEHIILFASDQPPGEKNDQDTIHEAHILSRLIKEQYSIACSIEAINFNVTDNEALLRFYRSRLGDLKKKYDGCSFLICDAGGTAQQKAGLKIMAEFILQEARYKVVYVNPDGRLTPVPQTEYRSVIASEQAAMLVSKANHDGAFQLLQGLEANENLLRLLEFIKCRINRNYKPAEDAARKSAVHFQFEFLNDYVKKKPIGANEEMQKIFNRDDFFILSDNLSIAQFYFLLEDLNKAVLNYAIFIESFLYRFITNKTEFDLVNKYGSSIGPLTEKLVADPSFKKPDGGKTLPGVPFYILAAEHFANGHPKVLKITGSFKKCYRLFNKRNQGLDSLRNDYAHKGLGVTPQRLEKALPGFHQTINLWHQAFGLPEQNIFVTMNDAFLKAARE